MSPSTHIKHDASSIPASGPILILTNTSRPQEIDDIEKKVSRPIHWILNQSDPIAPSLADKTNLTRLDISNPSILLPAVESHLKQGHAVALIRTADQAPVFVGHPKSLKKIDPALTFKIIPVWADFIWNNILSQFPHHSKTDAPHILFGTPIPSSEKEWFAQTYESLLNLGREALEKRPETSTSLGYACLHGLTQRHNTPIITDTYRDNKTLTGGMLLAISITLARWIQKNVREHRLGIILPPGLAGTIANLACVLSGKIPVNLNFTAGRIANESAIRQSHIKTIITADALAQKIHDFPWTEHKLDIGEILKSFPKWKFLFWRSLIAITPAPKIAKLIHLPEKGGNTEAALLFTSGSSGEPKGVVLTHRNILANVAQVNAILPKTKIPTLLGCLPIFHSFGFTVTLWWPLISGPKIVTYISPLDPATLANIIDKHSLSLMITTPTFLRTFMRRATSDQLKSLKLIVTGAEKLPMKLMNEFEATLHIPICEGYGMTEATPVISVNLLEDFTSNNAIPMRKAGSVGRMLPGICVRTTSTETGQPLSCFETGNLWYKGANIFSHYLGNPAKTNQVLVEGWYSSGDVGRIDEDGFLYIEGRMSRFSKIGGEMVPHGTIEQYLNEVCNEILPPEDESNHSFVMGISDSAKGESLVALTTSAAEAKDIRHKMLEKGLPGLWIPRTIRHVEKIPTLASGKLDIRACHSLVENLVKEDSAPRDSQTLP